MRRESSARWLLTGLLLLGGCQSSRDRTPSAPSDDTPEFQTATPQDPDIDPTDTYVAFDAEVTTTTTLTFSSPTPDPVTGQQVTQMTLPQPVENTFSVEAGYDEQGMVRVHEVGAWATTTDSATTLIPDAHHVAIVKGQLQSYSASGAQLAPGTPPDTAPAASGLLTHFGNDLLYGNISAGILVDSLTAAGATATRLSGDAGLRVSLDATAMAGGGLGGPKVERKYRRENDRWVLDEVSMVQDVATGKTKIHSSSVMKLRRLRYQVNPEHDAQRAKLRAAALKTAATLIEPSSASLLAVGRDRPRDNLYSCEFYHTCNDEPAPKPPPPPPPGRNVAWQHGFASPPGVWGQMQAWVQPLYRLNRVVTPDLSEYARAETQSSELINQLTATGLKGYLVVAHSMGGLVARRAAQQRPDLITGILAVGTPHLGAALAATGSAAISDVLISEATSLNDCSLTGVFDPGCYIARMLLHTAINSVIQWGQNAAAPATVDLLPIEQNPFLTSLALPVESFTRVGIKNSVAKGGIVVRLAADRFCGPYGSCGGRLWAKYWNAVHNAARTCQIFSALAGDFAWFIRCSNILNIQNNIDGYWNHLVAPGENKSDGIVQYSSQNYPRATFNYDVSNGDSHLGETQSDKIRPRITDAWNNQFLVPKP
jgi:pimeloyl-ACP methyl ester carboxylesterase